MFGDEKALIINQIASAFTFVTEAFLTGISFLASRRLQVCAQFGPTQHNYSSERASAPDPSFQKSSKPTIATAETGLFTDHFLRGTFLESISA